MARRSAADKEQTHQEILRHASRQFRARGSGVGIADVMKEMGLTHGGFYRHFENKDDLFLKAIALSFEEVGDKLEQAARSASGSNQVAAIIRAYLSADHLRHPETWCPLASLAPDFARFSISVRKQINTTMKHFMQRMAEFMPGADAAKRQNDFLLLFSGMAGSIAFIRSLADAGLRTQTLKRAQDHYLQTWTKHP